MALAAEKESACPAHKDPMPVKVKSEPTGDADDQLRNLLERPASGAAKTPIAAAKPSLQVAQPSSAATRLPGGQRTISSYFGSAKILNKDVVPKLQQDEEEECKTPAIDLESIRGIFGWTTLEGVHIPFILRQRDKFTAVRIIEKSLLKKYLQALPTDVYSCTYIKSYFITDNEAKLLNEINMKHCDRQFGHELFTTKDLVVQLNDVEQLYEFLATCYYKLTRPSQGHKKETRCGIIKVEGSAIPYIRRNGTKYVPLSLFDQESMKPLEMKTEKLEPWEVSYMKFCCKVASIGNEFLKQDSCPVVSVDDVQQTVSPSSHFEDWWPSSYIDSSSSNHHTSSSGAFLNCWSASDAQNVQVSKDKNGFKSPYHLSQAMSPSTYFDKGIAPTLHNLYACANSERELVAPLLPMVSAPCMLASKSPADGKSLGNGRLDDELAGGASQILPNARLSYPIDTSFQLSPSGITSPNPQAFIYNHGQWWGSMASRSLDGRYCPPGIAHCQSLAAHCPQGPTQCSPSATQMPRNSLVYPASVLTSNSSASQHLSRYAQNANQSNKDPKTSHSSGPQRDSVPQRSSMALRTPERRHLSNTRISEQSSQEGSPRSKPNQPAAPPLLRINFADNINRGCQTVRSSDSRSSPRNDEQFRVVLPKALPPPLVNDNNNLPRISNVMSLTSMKAHSSGSLSGGTPVMMSPHSGTRQNNGSLRSMGGQNGSFLAKHLLNSNGSNERHHIHHLENYVVAPGNVQSLAGKMSSPKPGNQVPTSVTGDHAHRQPPLLMDGITRTLPAILPPPAHLSGLVSPLLRMPNGQALFNSKLQELLNHSEAVLRKTPSSHSNAVHSHSSTLPRRQTLPRYKIQSVLLSGTKFRAINSVEYEYHSGLMVPIVELSAKIKPRTSSQTFRHILADVFGLRLFECNRIQEELLKDQLESFSGNCRNTLICIEDLMKYLPQLSYTVARLRTQEEKDNQPVAKRARVETVVSS